MSKIRATLKDLAVRYFHRSKHTVRAVRRAGGEAIRADLAALAFAAERIANMDLSPETSNWETKKIRQLQAKLAAEPA